MQFLVDVGRLIFAALPHLLLNPEFRLLPLICVGLVLLMYRRTAVMEQALYGGVLNPAWVQTLYGIMYGVVAGVLGSFAMLLAGISLPLIPGSLFVFWYLWPLALALSLIHPRFLCFSYAGSLVGLSYLLFGWPRVDVASLCALVALLHLVEGVLVLTSATSCRTPVTVQNDRGETVAGFSLQRFWPVPIMILLLDPTLPAGGEGVAVPGWWPLLRPDPALVPPGNLMYVAAPAMVVMGYADMAVRQSTTARARLAARNLLVYSLVLLGLAMAAAYWRPVVWAAALFCSLGHEAITAWAGRLQLQGLPYLQRPPRGVGVHEVLPRSVAAAAGMQAGDVIVAVDDVEVHSRHDVAAALVTAPAYVRVLYRRGGQLEHRRLPRPRNGLAGLGVIFLPEPGDAPTVRVAGAGAFLQPLLRLAARLGQRRRRL